MSDVAFSQLITFYEKTHEGIIIVRNGAIFHASRAMCDMADADLNGHLIYDVLDCDTIERIDSALSVQNTACFENAFVCGKNMQLCAMKMKSGYVLIVHSENNMNSEEARVRFCASTIAALAVLFRDPIMTINAALERVLRSIPEDIISENKKYLTMIRQNCFLALKNAEMIEAEGHQILNTKNDSQMKQHDIVRMLKSINTMVSGQFGKNKIELILGDMPQRCLVACNAKKIQTAFYCAIAALIKCSPERRCVKIAVNKSDSEVTVDFYAVGECWCKEQIDFAYGRRIGHLAEDIQKYGFDILRLNQIMSGHNGEVLIEPYKDGNHITLVIPKAKPTMLMEEYSDEPEDFFAALIALSDVLPDEFYE